MKPLKISLIPRLPLVPVAYQPTRAINDRASFLPVKSSTANLVNLRSLGYR